MEATKTKPALTKTQREILELLKVEGEYARLNYRMTTYTLEKSGRTITYKLFQGLNRFTKPMDDPKNPRSNRVHRYYPPEEKAADRAKQEADDQQRARLAAERLADRNRRWAEAIRKCVSDNAVVFFSEIELAAVFDAIASEASCGEVAELLKR